jgi:hypothetical protein
VENKTSAKTLLKCQLKDKDYAISIFTIEEMKTHIVTLIEVVSDITKKNERKKEKKTF